MIYRIYNKRLKVYWTTVPSSWNGKYGWYAENFTLEDALKKCEEFINLGINPEDLEIREGLPNFATALVTIKRFKG